MEQGESGCKEKAAVLIKEYDSRFRIVEYTLHPRDIPGESQGKSSNLSWAAKYINAKYPKENLKRNVIITVLDGKKPLPCLSFPFDTDLNFPHSRLTSLYQILLSNYDPSFPSPHHSRDDHVCPSNHLRPQRASCPPSRPRRRPFLGRRWSLRPLSHLYHLPPHIRLLSPTLSCPPCRWLGCR